MKNKKTYAMILTLTLTASLVSPGTAQAKDVILNNVEVRGLEHCQRLINKSLKALGLTKQNYNVQEEGAYEIKDQEGKTVGEATYDPQTKTCHFELD